MQKQPPTFTVNYNILKIENGQLHQDVQVPKDIIKNTSICHLYAFYVSPISEKGILQVVALLSLEDVYLKECLLTKHCLSFRGICLKNLRLLKINDCGLTGEEMLEISKVYMPNIEKIDLAGRAKNKNRIGVKGAKYLLQGNWEKLNLLSLSGNEIGIGGVKAIVAAKMHSLHDLYLGWCKLSYQGVQLALKCSSVKQMHDFFLGFNDLSQSQQKKVKQQIQQTNSNCNTYC